MKKLYILSTPYLLDEQKKLFDTFIIANKSNLNFIETLNAIANHLEKFQIVNNEIDDLYWCEKEKTYIYSMDVRDILGKNRSSIVIKQLRNFNHTYEIRINQQYYKHRILFQFNHLMKNKTLKEEFFILSYAFSKIDGQEDVTDDLSSSNDSIKEEILQNGNEKIHFDKWLGGEWREY